MSMLDTNNVLLNDFLSKNINSSGIIVTDKTDFDYIQINISLQQHSKKNYQSLFDYLFDPFSSSFFCCITQIDFPQMTKHDFILLREKLSLTSSVLVLLDFNLKTNNLFYIAYQDLFNTFSSSDYFGQKKSSKLIITLRGNALKKSISSIFIESKNEQWLDVSASVIFPFISQNIKEAALNAINSSRNILTHYVDIKNLRVTEIHKMSSRGYALEKLKL